MTAKQYLKANPQQYRMVSREAGQAIYIAPLENLAIQTTTDAAKAEIFSSLDRTQLKLNYHRAATGLINLNFEQI